VLFCGSGKGVGLADPADDGDTTISLQAEFRTSADPVPGPLRAATVFDRRTARPGSCSSTVESTGPSHRTSSMHHEGEDCDSRELLACAVTTSRPSRRPGLYRASPQDLGISLETKATPTRSRHSRSARNSSDLAPPRRHRSRPSSKQQPIAVQQPLPTTALLLFAALSVTTPRGSVRSYARVPPASPRPPALPDAVQESQRRVVRRPESAVMFGPAIDSRRTGVLALALLPSPGPPPMPWRTDLGQAPAHHPAETSPSRSRRPPAPYNLQQPSSRGCLTDGAARSGQTGLSRRRRP